MKFIKTVSHQIIIYLTLLSVCSCSTNSRMNIIQPGDTMSIVLSSNSNNEKLFKFDDSHSMKEGAKTGAYAGAAGGAAYSLFCGPFVIICAPVFSLIGAASGGIVGGSVNASILVSDSDKNTLLFNKMEDYLKINNPQDIFLKRVISLAEPKYPINLLSDNKIYLVVDKLAFNTISDGRVILEMNAKITVKYIDKLGEINRFTKDYHYMGAPQFLDTWLDGDNEFYQTKLINGYDTLAENILRTL